MARHKDSQWDLPEGVKGENGVTHHRWESIQTAVLMDIRDELKSINSILHCSNFLEIPRMLRALKRNTAQKRKPKK